MLPIFCFSQDVMFSHSSGSRTEIKSQVNIDYRFKFDVSKNSTNIKIFHKEKFIKSQSIKNKDTLVFSYAKSLGSTHNSEGQDVFIFYFGDYKKSRIQFYSWNQNEFLEFNKPFKDSSFFNYKRNSSQLIVESLVNFRRKPDQASKVISVLEFGSKVKLLQNNVKYDTVNQKRGSWAKILYRKDTGFIWQDYLSFYYFQSYKEENLRFIIRDSYDYRHQIIAARENKVIDTFSFYRISNFMGAHSRGNLGLENVKDIIGVCYSGESCGVPSGDVLIAWDGNNFHKLINEEGTGDGGLSYGQSIVFPSHISGRKNSIKVNTYDSESIDVYKGSKEDDNYDNINRLYLSRNFVYQNWKLSEVNSETKELEKLLASQFPSFNLRYFEKGDLNGDGVKDAILYAVDTANSLKEDYAKKPNKSLIVIAFKGVRTGYFIKTYSNKIIVHEENSPLTRVEIKPIGFRLNIYYSGYYNDENNPRQYFMDYKYDKIQKDFILDQVTEFFPPINYSGDWEKKEYFYKKNRILFKDSYHPEWSE